MSYPNYMSPEMGRFEKWALLLREESEEHTLAFVATILFVAVNALIFIWWHHPLYGKNIGPRVYPFVGSLPSAIQHAHRLLDFSVETLRKSPTLTIRYVQSGYTAYSTANVENVEYVLKTKFDNFVKGERMGDVLFDLLGRGIFNADGNLWKLQRKLASHEFSSRSLREFGVECVQKELQNRLVPVLSQFSENGNVVDLQDLLMRFSFDNICQLGFGVDPNCLEPSLPPVKFAEAFDKANECTLLRFRTFPIMLRLYKFFNIGIERGLKESMAVVHNFAQEVIEARRKEFNENHGDIGHARQDLLSRFMLFTDSSNSEVLVQSDLERKCISDLNLDASDAKEKQKASDIFLRDMVISFVLAGRDTTSLGLSWFFYALGHNPHVEAKIYDEIKEQLQLQAQEDDSLPSSRPPGQLFTFEQLKKLHYLHAALHESLRLFPPVPWDSKHAVRDDVLPDGTVILKGERVTFNIYAMARMEANWGPDCNEFKPERWLKDGVFVPESPFKFATFQAGPRICLGKEMALIQMKLVASSLVYCFKFTLLEDPPRTCLSFVFKMLNGFPVIVHKRAVST
ncbi:cytochrome P450 CYP94D108 [Physcomitrium patens]|uniref:Cytochrome P450 n=1 Tax=Physcomitrium patens TaxID=3218 RepID=A0A2K1L9C6_PHYPA|nr:cytochrome P450 94B3-like [Physcomitrium patens]PNR62639.1 hypothetical protein PHYPA_001063 [Physcomitrium patens]|eukprot:XP_024380866.1 cytochrome P450 94B3-like [Physcomitrella patens]